MQGARQAIGSTGFNILKRSLLQRIRLVGSSSSSPAASAAVIPSVFSSRIRCFSSSSSPAPGIEEQGFESTTISDVLTSKGKSADGSWLWCKTDDTVYDAVVSMTQHNVGALVVVKPGEKNSIAGIITERAELRELEEMKLKSVLELYSSWEAWKETFFQKIITYHLPPTCSLLLSKDLSSLTVIVTGSTNGIGLHIARELAKAGAHVVMACRNTILAEKVASSWREETRSNGELVNIDVMELDLSSFASVRKFAKEWEKLDLALDLLINNAGVLQVEDVQKFTRDGIEQHIHVNHVAPALLTLLLLPSLSKARSSRIINVNSVAHYVGVVEPQYWNSRDEEEKYTSLRAYGSSKLAQIMFLKVLGNKLLELNKTTIQSIAVHPGAVCSNLNSQQRKKHYFMFDADQGARSALFCATSNSVADNLVKGFAYYSVRCKPGKISSKAEDMGACLDVWQKTIELLDLGNDYLSRRWKCPRLVPAQDV